jgi:hypothetical protein
VSAAWQARWRLESFGEPDHIAHLFDRATGERVGFAVKGNASWTVTVAAHQFTAPTRRQALIGLDAGLTALQPNPYGVVIPQPEEPR